MRVNKEILGKLQTYFISRLGMYEYRRGWLKGECPKCGRVDKYGVNLSMGKTNCFVCGYNSRPIEVIRELENLRSYSETLIFIKAFESSSFFEYVPEILESPSLTMPTGFKLLNQGNGEVGKIIRRYVKGRGLNIENLSLRGFGYCDTGEYFGHFIIPYYQNGQLVYFNARRVIGGGTKFKNPPEEVVGIGKSLVIYNVDALGIYEKIYLVESAINAETLGDNSIGIGGKKISNYQLSQLIRKSSITNLIIILDPDAYLEALNLGLTLVHYKKIKIIRLPEGEDVNSLGKRATMMFIRKSKFLDYSALLKMKLNYERPINSYSSF